MVKIEDYAREYDGSRSEVLAFKFTGVMKNVGEILYLSAVSNMDEYNRHWVKQYPKLDMLRVEINKEKRFYISSMYTGPEFLKYMRDKLPPRDINDIQRDYGKLRGKSEPEKASITNIEIMARNLAMKPDIQKIYIYDVAFSTESQLYLTKLFAGYERKVILIEKSFSELLQLKPEITTIFTDSADEVINYLQLFPEKSMALKDKMIYLSANPSIDNISNPDAPFKYNDILKTAPLRWHCGLEYFQLKYVPYFNK